MKMPLVTRRTALKAVGATALLPWLSEEGLAAFATIQAKAAPPRPTVLTTAQYATVAALVEAIIPADERSPGAREARVADYIDLLLGEAEAPLREQWLAGLGALDAEAGKRFGAPFVKLPEDQMAALLTDISRYETAPKPAADAALDIPRNEQPKPPPPQVDTLLGDIGRHPAGRTALETFFFNTKQATIHGYYTSEIGIHKELRYKGNQSCPTSSGASPRTARIARTAGGRRRPEMSADTTLDLDLAAIIDESRRLAASDHARLGTLGRDRGGQRGGGRHGRVPARHGRHQGAGARGGADDRPPQGVPDDGVAVRLASPASGCPRPAPARRRRVQLPRPPLRRQPRLREVQEGRPPTRATPSRATGW